MVKPHPSGNSNRFTLERSGKDGVIEQLEARRASDGKWSFRDPSAPMKHGDIFDLAIRNGAPDFKGALGYVIAYATQRRITEPSEGQRQRYDNLREAEAKALEKEKLRQLSDTRATAKSQDTPPIHETNAPDDKTQKRKTLTFAKDKNKSVAQDKGDGVSKHGGRSLRFAKDKDRDDGRSR